jgi:hypothetical protein
MRSLARFTALLLLILSSAAYTGCASQTHSPSTGEDGFAGGNGAFGEDPSHPGMYRGSTPGASSPAPRADAR